jgi:hypothetical protein
MGNHEELAIIVKRLEDEMKILREQNANLKKKLGIRQFLKPNIPSTTTTMETDAEGNSVAPVKTAKTVKEKPLPFFVNGITSITNFKKWLTSVEIVPCKMKALANGELKIDPSNSDKYRKCRTLFSELSDKNKKSFGAIKYHTY